VKNANLTCLVEKWTPKLSHSGNGHVFRAARLMIERERLPNVVELTICKSKFFCFRKPGFFGFLRFGTKI